jgi:hypothetical protein
MTLKRLLKTLINVKGAVVDGAELGAIFLCNIHSPLTSLGYAKNRTQGLGVRNWAIGKKLFSPEPSFPPPEQVS